MHTCLPSFRWHGGRASWGVRRTVGLGLSLLLALFLILGRIAPVFALGSSRLTLSGLIPNAFPAILFSLELVDSQGVFVSDLKPDELSLREDGLAVQPVELKIQPRSLQFSLALNAAPELAASPANPRPDSPVSQMEGIRQALLNWASQQSGEGGDFSLATATGMQVIRSREPAQWAQGLKDYQPDLAKAQSSLFSLSTALDLAAERAADEATKPVVLFVTPPLAEKEAGELALQADRAQKSGVRVFVWLVAPDAKSPPPNQEALLALADVSGGKLEVVSAGSAFPDLENWLSPLRQIYQVTYPSIIQKSGRHTLSAQVSRPGLQLSAERDLSFQLEVSPPNPMFVQPPVRVERTWSEETNQQQAQLMPQVIPLEVVVEFPDGYPRPLKTTRLYQDERMVADNKAEPFNQFSWNLDGLTQNTALKLRVEAVDSQGLSGSSVEVPVEVSVAPKPAASLLPHVSPQGLIAVGAVLLAGLVLGLVILGENRLRRRQSRGALRRMKDPVTQPVVIPQVAPRARKAPAMPSWPKIERGASTPARLVRLNEHNLPISGGPVSINRPELTFGSDAHLAIVALDDPSVQALHARLTHPRDDSFFLQDEKSVAGTWVNYSPLNGKARKLEHGDLIHMGRVLFRFELTNPPPAREPVVSLVDEAL